MWMPKITFDDKSTLVQLMAWCRQAISNCLSQCWPRSMSPYGVIRPQWLNSNAESRGSRGINCVVTSGTGGCCYDNQRCPQWQQSWRDIFSERGSQSTVTKNNGTIRAASFNIPLQEMWYYKLRLMMTSWHGNVFRCIVTLCGESSDHCAADSPYKWPVMQTTEYFFVVPLNKVLNSRPSFRWFVMSKRSSDVTVIFVSECAYVYEYIHLTLLLVLVKICMHFDNCAVSLQSSLH